MAKTKTSTISGEVQPPDFEQAHRIYQKDIAPAATTQKRAMKEQSDGWKAVKGDARVNVSGFKTAAKVSRMEEAEQQAFLRAFRGGCDAFNLVLHADLADQANGVNEETMPIVPIGEAPAIELPAVH